MSEYMDRVRSAFGPNRRNLAVAGFLVAVLAFTHLVVPHWSTRYASYLLVFSVWMAWFVHTVAGLLDVEEE